MSAELALETVLAERLGKVQEIDLAVLVGSQARGDTHECSDVDVLVDVEGDTATVLLTIYEALVEALGRCDIDVPTLAVFAQIPTVWTKAVSEGKVLVDRRERWDSIQADPDAARIAAQVPLADLTQEEQEAVSHLEAEQRRIERWARLGREVPRLKRTNCCHRGAPDG